MKYKRYNRTNTCDRCREENIITVLIPGKACREYNKKGNWTGKWICHDCYNKDYQKNNSNSQNNIRKSLTDRRTGNLDPNSSQAKGDFFEDLTSLWLGVKRLSVEYDKYSMLPLDHSTIPDNTFVNISGILCDLSGKIPQTKGRLFDMIYGYWNQNVTSEHGKLYDYLIFYCVSNDGKHIERVYIIPKEDVTKRTCIGIVKIPKGRWGNVIIPWYKKYRITDEEAIKKVNDIWKEIIKRRYMIKKEE